MHRLRSPGTVGQWTAVLSALLMLGPLVQWGSPCGRTAPDAPASEAVSPVAPGAQWTCAQTVVATMGRAVSAERPESVRGSGPLGAEGLGTGEIHVPSAPKNTQGHPPRLPVSPTLDRLRPVVLQI